MTVEIGADLATNGGFENSITTAHSQRITACSQKIPGWDLEVIHGKVIADNGYRYKDERGLPGSLWAFGGSNMTSIEYRTHRGNWTDVEIWSGHDSECAIIADGTFFFVLTQRIPTEGKIRVDESILANVSFWMSCKDFTGVKSVKIDVFGDDSRYSQETSYQHFANFTSDWSYGDVRSGMKLDPGVEYITFTIAIAGSGTIAIDDFSFMPEGGDPYSRPRSQ